MKREHFLIGIAWIATVVVAYFIGSSGESSKGNASAAGAAGAKAEGAGASAASADAKQQRSFIRKFGDFDEATLGADGKPNVVALIARARQQFASGMGGMMNIRAMLRAIAPLAELDDSQLQDALAEVEKTVRDPQQKMMFYSLLLGQWAESDGKAALAYAEEKLGSGSPFDMGVRASILGSWARRDPDGVWKWFQTERKDDGNERTKGMLVSMVFAGMAANDLDTALQRLSTLDETTRGMAMSGIANSANNETSRKRLLDRAQTLAPEQRNQIRQGIVGQWAMSDSDAAIKWIHSLPADEQKPVRESAANMMLMMQPAKGAELLLEGAEEKDKPRLYDRVVGQWAWQDSKAAGEWLSKQSQGPELDDARRTYSMAVAQKDPSAAMDWAKSVQNPEQRNQSVEMVYQQWRTKDVAAADTALDATDLPPEKIKQLKSAPAPTSTKTGAVLSFPR
jgi:hypothetical protein